eukprot:CAMPEP_0176129846 /NCGR_PEP_ID=MMETSP0120_2-20121206/65675_1 /TAXON_ID=160619 /ORGANISM="Kryptoperidinium foliaceum, Strain CCMP 1326" /LENGTH=50 /DNA_ID=CAMNT_0017465083 /DNA_START=120 /DNA_END=268 /DNA_ORIENTATION=-
MAMEVGAYWLALIRAVRNILKAAVIVHNRGGLEQTAAVAAQVCALCLGCS